jgi:hypothetical protein
MDEKGSTSDEEKATASSIHQNAEAQKDVSVLNYLSYLALTLFVGRRRFFN